MYEKRFGLNRKPFQSVLNAHEFFSSEAFRELWPAVRHALHSDLGVAVLTGPAGVGKSTSLESIRRSLEPDSQTVVVRGGTARTSSDLLHVLQRRLLKSQSKEPQSASSPASACRWDVVERLQRTADFWGPLVILLDDAHLLQTSVFAELRALLEEEVNGQRLVRLLIAGPLELEEILAEPAMGDFAGKIRTHVFLQPLRTIESIAYLRHQILNSGGSLADIFERGAVESVVAASGGIPRCLNLLADESLMVCEEADLPRVTVDVVNSALGRLQHLPLTWNAAPVAAGPEQEPDETDADSEVAPQESGAAVEDSVVEIGTASGASAAFIEIGGPSSAEPPPTTVAVSDTVEVGSGVIEIGCPGERNSEPAMPERVVAEEVVAEEILAEELVAEELVAEITESPECELPPTTFLDCASTTQPTNIVEWETTTTEGIDLATDVISPADAEDTEIPAAELSNDENWEAESVSVTDDSDSGHAPVDNDDSDADRTDLVHHLVLASSESADAFEDESLPDEEEGSEAAVEFTISGFDNSAETVSDVDLSYFTPWQPAGEWPSPSITVDESCHAAEADESTSYFSAQATNRTPVFDRYTWCELGRPVLPDERQRTTTMAIIEHNVMWPPSVSGVAPVRSIPVMDIDEDFDEMLQDISIVTAPNPPAKDTVESPAQDGLAESSSQEQDTSERPDSHDSAADQPSPQPDVAIDQIQELLQAGIDDQRRTQQSNDMHDAQADLAEQTAPEWSDHEPVYTPSLLQEARTKVATVYSASNEPAADLPAAIVAAEAARPSPTLPAEPQPKDTESPTEHCAAVPDDSEFEAEKTSGFRDLFTRLRRLKHRSA